jgi:glycosyltransferase involved in cell wall biosynthesis
MKIVIISHTEHYKNQDGKISGWGPTIREINHLAKDCETLIHLAPLHAGQPPQSSLSYNYQNISYQALKPSGGHGLEKLSLIKNAFYNLKLIHQHTADADWIQFRAPTGIGIYVLPYLKFFRNKKYWVKYAGNWVDPEMPIGNKLQKFWLKNLATSAKVTINGHWEQEERFLAFENPSLTSIEYEQSKLAVDLKTNPKQEGWRLCFVGALNEHKGVSIILEALEKSPDELKSKLKEIIFIGDGKGKESYQKKAESLDVACFFLGFLDKENVFQQLSQSHALILPSKSEGFPKVIGEAMATGCVPISTDVSCIKDYIVNTENGFVMQERTSHALQISLTQLLNLSYQEYKSIILKNLNFAERFTYAFYNKALKSRVFEC